MARHIFVTGGVLSSLGKGLASAALGALLKARGFKVRIRKFEPYLNVDPGTMSPSQHGEVYVTDDGAETDLDLGHYERYTGVPTRASDATTTGQIYQKVISKERKGDYLGATVQVVPHITNMIQEHITYDIEDDIDFVICEVGGTIGDIEGLPFVEAIRQFIHKVGHEKSMFIHLTLIPYVPSADELKTKPTQHSVKQLQQLGIQPDMLLCRCDRHIPEDSRKKLSLFCNIQPERVIEAIDVDTIYKVPISYHMCNMDVEVLKYFGLDHSKEPDLSLWEDIVDRTINYDKEVNIAVVAKYLSLRDSYKSLTEALSHAGIHHRAKVNITWINSEDLEINGKSKSIEDVKKQLNGFDGILIPGGYGKRGVEGKISAIRYARENKIPFMGICLGMQLAVIETARNLASLENAGSTEFGATTDPIVGLMTEWYKDGEIQLRDAESNIGGTMRLGSYDCHLTEDSLAHNVYKNKIIKERHRHRYEVNIKYKDTLKKAGMEITGVSKSGILPTMVERPDHPWFLAMQFHPEFKSYPFKPSLVFVEFIGASMKNTKT